jgi:hypothetical protein
LSGGSPRAVRAMFSAIRRERASIMPSVQPETSGFMRTFPSSWNGNDAENVGTAEVRES